MCETGTGQQVAQLHDSYMMMMMMMMIKYEYKVTITSIELSYLCFPLK